MQIIESYNLNKEMISLYFQNKGGVLIGSGRSMLPTLRENWRIKIVPISADEIKPGDIALINADILCIHRIIARFKKNNQLFFIEKGDNSSTARIVSQEQIVGKVAEVYDNDSNKIDTELWRSEFLHPLVYILTIFFFYRTLRFLKRLTLGNKEYKLFNSLARLYWNFLLRTPQG
jgi:hypothetical protein